MIRSGRFVSVLAALLLILMPALSTAQSQATTGVIEGTVSDPSGAPIAGAPGPAQNTATNLARPPPPRARPPGPPKPPPPTPARPPAADADGRFRALLLPLGPYKVTISLTGF